MYNVVMCVAVHLIRAGRQYISVFLKIRADVNNIEKVLTMTTCCCKLFVVSRIFRRITIWL